MKKAIRLTVALVAALAFTTAWADDTKDDKKCDSKDMPCATEVVQDGNSEESTSAGSGAGEASTSDTASNEVYWENQQHEHWESGD